MRQMGLSSPATLSTRALAWLLCHLSPMLPDTSFVLLSLQIFLQLETLCSKHSSPKQVHLLQEGTVKHITSWKKRPLFHLYLLGRQEHADSTLYITEFTSAPREGIAQTLLIGVNRKMGSSIVHEMLLIFLEKGASLPVLFISQNTLKDEGTPGTSSRTSAQTQHVWQL